MSIAGVFVIALMTVLVLTPVARWVAIGVGIVDHSDGKRKLHAAPVPLLGGVAVYASLVAALVAALWFSPATVFNYAWLASAGLICLVGWCDDAWRLAPRWKLLGQTLAALPIVATEWQARSLAIAGESLELGWWAAPLLLVWLLACINALNFLDGVDGLASSCGLVAAAFLATIAESQGQTATLFASVALCGALAGFLAFNVAPAKIYLGDAGSMMIGLTLAVFSLEVFQSPAGAVAPVAMGMLLALPLLDVVLAITRRTLSGRPFWQADRFHIHHRLLERGCTAHETTALLAGLCVLSGFAAAVMTSTGVTWPTLVVAAGVLATLVHVQLIANHEWTLVKQATARLLIAAAARIGETTLGRDLPEFADLEKLTDASQWEQFRELVETRSLAQLSVACGQGTHVLWNQSCGARALESPAPWSMQLDFRPADGTWCRMQVRLTDFAAARPWELVELLAALRHFGRFWTEHAAPQIVDVMPFPEDRRAA